MPRRPRGRHRGLALRSALASAAGDGVGGGVDLLELRDGHGGVDLSGRDVRVAELRLNMPDVRTVVEHGGGDRVAEGVAAPSIARALRRAPRADHCSAGNGDDGSRRVGGWLTTGESVSPPMRRRRHPTR